MANEHDPLVEIVMGALGASLRADEPRWSKPRDWDAREGMVLRRHAENVAAAIRSSGWTSRPAISTSTPAAGVGMPSGPVGGGMMAPMPASCGTGAPPVAVASVPTLGTPQ